MSISPLAQLQKPYTALWLFLPLRIKLQRMIRSELYLSIMNTLEILQSEPARVDTGTIIHIYAIETRAKESDN